MSVSAASIYNANINMQDHASSLAKPDSHAAERPSVESPSFILVHTWLSLPPWALLEWSHKVAMNTGGYAPSLPHGSKTQEARECLQDSIDPHALMHTTSMEFMVSQARLSESDLRDYIEFKVP